VSHGRSNVDLVRWSSRRKRYERQGILAEAAAIEQAAQVHTRVEDIVTAWPDGVAMLDR
jgi:hypothetical protein